MAFTVLRTAAGSPVAPFVIRALCAVPDVRVVAVDIEPLSSGFQLAHAHRVVPRVTEGSYIPAMLRVCQEESVDLLFPDLDEELALLAGARAEFEALGTRVLTSGVPTIEICVDKHATYQFLRKRGFPTPASFLPGELPDASALHWPLIVKPRSGRGSRDVFRASQPRELDFFIDYVENPLIQEFVPGAEYTIDTLSDLSGNFLYAVVRQRLATDSGISIRGRTVEHAAIKDLVKRIVQELGLIGPACVQCIETDSGEAKVIEINPRIAGGSALSMAAGAPIVADIIRLARGERPHEPSRIRTGLIMLRHWEEQFFDERGREVPRA